MGGGRRLAGFSECTCYVITARLSRAARLGRQGQRKRVAEPVLSANHYRQSLTAAVQTIFPLSSLVDKGGG